MSCNELLSSETAFERMHCPTNVSRWQGVNNVATSSGAGEGGGGTSKGDMRKITVCFIVSNSQASLMSKIRTHLITFGS